MAEIAKHGQAGWEQPRWGEAIFAARSQVFLHPFSPNTAGSGPAKTSRSQERVHNRSSMGRGWETQGRPPGLAAWGRKRSTAQVTSVPASRAGRGADPLKPSRPSLRTPKPSRCLPGVGAHVCQAAHLAQTSASSPAARRGQACYARAPFLIFLP